MCIEFRKVSGFNRGTILNLLSDAYSFDERMGQCWRSDWEEFDDFFFDNLQIADQYGFITTLDGEAIGLVSWDPRNMPEYVEVGHNCIKSTYKGRGYGTMQLEEAVNRIMGYDVKKIIVTTNAGLFPAQRMYESVGFKIVLRRKNSGIADFAGEYIDYEIIADEFAGLRHSSK
ncbi:GNAT family N-acetyltransferase [Robinsoniella peoriensis]|uniref:Ribosomal-protein-alanine acetyltransferase n=1 Tax=Robinsoniella peoriensis TaxID=180332 RepID=A0A4U8PZX3_9FIRM|nr:GNAT family N-acetyltransferase [Robinsoniella peoriensis]TLC97816.1 ribosomal-protein-alanine acetyltransferase [Robinsoniella peoriensis]